MTSFAEYKDQLLALGVTTGPEATTLANLTAALDEEKTARVVAQVEAEVLSRAVHDLKVSADRFASQIPTLEDKVKHLEDKVVEGLKQLRARELCLESTSRSNDNYQKEVAHLTKKLESKSLIWVLKHLLSSDFFSLFPLWLTESDVKLNALKAMVNNAVVFFYPGESSSKARAPQMLDSLSSWSREVILANMRQSASLTLGILKSLKPRADLDMTGEGFAVTCSDKEALKLVEDSGKIAGLDVDMLGVDMSLGYLSSLFSSM
jgi:hypothetical protein